MDIIKHFSQINLNVFYMKNNIEIWDMNLFSKFIFILKGDKIAEMDICKSVFSEYFLNSETEDDIPMINECFTYNIKQTSNGFISVVDDIKEIQHKKAIECFITNNSVQNSFDVEQSIPTNVEHNQLTDYSNEELFQLKIIYLDIDFEIFKKLHNKQIYISLIDTFNEIELAQIFHSNLYLIINNGVSFRKCILFLLLYDKFNLKMFLSKLKKMENDHKLKNIFLRIFQNIDTDMISTDTYDMISDFNCTPEMYENTEEFLLRFDLIPESYEKFCNYLRNEYNFIVSYMFLEKSLFMVANNPSSLCIQLSLLQFCQLEKILLLRNSVVQISNDRIEEGLLIISELKTTAVTIDLTNIVDYRSCRATLKNLFAVERICRDKNLIAHHFFKIDNHVFFAYDAEENFICLNNTILTHSNCLHNDYYLQILLTLKLSDQNDSFLRAFPKLIECYINTRLKCIDTELDLQNIYTIKPSNDLPSQIDLFDAVYQIQLENIQYSNLNFFVSNSAELLIKGNEIQFLNTQKSKNLYVFSLSKIISINTSRYIELTVSRYFIFIKCAIEDEERKEVKRRSNSMKYNSSPNSLFDDLENMQIKNTNFKFFSELFDVESQNMDSILDIQEKNIIYIDICNVLISSAIPYSWNLFYLKNCKIAAMSEIYTYTPFSKNIPSQLKIHIQNCIFINNPLFAGNFLNLIIENSHSTFEITFAGKTNIRILNHTGSIKINKIYAHKFLNDKSSIIISSLKLIFSINLTKKIEFNNIEFKDNIIIQKEDNYQYEFINCIFSNDSDLMIQSYDYMEYSDSSRLSFYQLILSNYYASCSIKSGSFSNLKFERISCEQINE